MFDKNYLPKYVFFVQTLHVDLKSISKYPLPVLPLYTDLKYLTKRVYVRFFRLKTRIWKIAHNLSRMKTRSVDAIIIFIEMTGYRVENYLTKTKSITTHTRQCFT